DYYDQASEGGVLWNDPDLAIDWPVSDPMLSDKDAKYAPLKDIDQKLLPRYEDTNG
ncbi:MAG: dTDP-4-dehydrorhamnose 3,5-epimerase family protein, partial [Planctomycetes bacterium]|nr:dTDP-4-dehydrorhamnose 3,5-epimerase family protein [Planctomycetota bacterium]